MIFHKPSFRGRSGLRFRQKTMRFGLSGAGKSCRKSGSTMGMVRQSHGRQAGP